MTYNFDPEKWYDMERAALASRHKKGELTDHDFKQALDDLSQR